MKKTIKSSTTTGAQVRRGRPPKKHEAAISNRILVVATEAFLSSGYDQTNMDDLAARAGCSKRTLYSRFSSKEGLFSAAISLLVQERLDLVELAVGDTETLEDKLTDAAVAIESLALADDSRNLLRLAIQEGHRFPEIPGVIDQVAWKPARQLVSDLLSSGLPHRNDERDLAILAESFLAVTAITPLHRSFFTGQSVCRSRQDIRQLVRLFLYGVT